MAMVLRLAASLPLDRMGIVEADQPLTLGAMQRKGIVDAMRLLRRYRHPRHHEPDPVATFRVNHEDLTACLRRSEASASRRQVKVQQDIEGRVAWLRHAGQLSH